MPVITDKKDKNAALCGFTNCAACGDRVRDDIADTVSGHTVCRGCHTELARAFSAIDELTADAAPLFWKILFAEYRREYEVFIPCQENHWSA